MKIEGRTYHCRDNIDTDVIIPAKYLAETDPAALAAHAMEGLDPDFNKKPHDIIVAGKNFGSGSSREHAPIALKAAGVKCIVAKSFARIFYRNAINIGLPVVICKDAGKIGDRATIHLDTGEIILPGEILHFPPYSEVVREILFDGGLIPHLKKKLGKK
ncbi:MAG: 3-isopropylmalate dehydratase small subunit [Candidatus Micrarchaeia archaeon]